MLWGKIRKSWKIGLVLKNRFLCFVLSIVFLLTLGITGCSNTRMIEQSIEDQSNIQTSASNADTESEQIAELYRDIYEQAVHANTLGSLEVIEDIMKRLGENGHAVVDIENQNQIDMIHSELLEQFCKKVDEKQRGEVTVFSIMENGGFIRFDLVTGEGEVEVTRSVLNWEGSMKSEISNGKFVPKVGYQNKYPAYNWVYNEKGYLFFEEYFPEGYDGAPGYTAIRLKALDRKCRELNRQYILPIGYASNNMFLFDWSEEDFLSLNFYDAFDICYPLVYNKKTPYEKTVEGTTYAVPQEEFEKVIMSYFQIDRETLRNKTVYSKQNQTYEYRTRSFNDSSALSNTPYPEVVSYEEFQDGTIKLTVNVVWPGENTAQAFSHEVVIRILEDGRFCYVSNHIISSEENREPMWYSVI